MNTYRIFAGGDFQVSETLKIGSQDIIICADKGLNHAKSLKITPDIVVGDFDSYKDKLPENTEIFYSVPEKDDTDTMLAVKIALERGDEKIIIHGALGGRFDHAFANIQTLVYLHKQGCEAEISDCGNVMTVCGEGKHSFELWNDWYFSVFAITEKLEIESMSGVKYSLKNYCMENSFPLGVSNEITESRALLKIRSGIALVVRSKM